MESNNNLKWLCFSGMTDDYPIWSTRFQAFSQTKGLFETLTGDEPAPTRPTRLGNDPTNEQRAAHEAAEAEYTRALENIEKRKNTLWCYLVMVLDTTSLMLIRHDCVDNKGLGDGHKAWGLLQERFRSNETVTVVSVMRQLARLTLKEDEALPQYFIRAQELSTRLGQAGEHLSEPLLNAMVLNGLPERYEHFVVQESFNPAGSFVELRTRLTNYEESRQHREKVDHDGSHVAMISKKIKSKPKSSGKYTSLPKSNSGQTCYCCGMKGHLKTDCYHKDKAECTYCKLKGHFEKACIKKTKESKGAKHGSLASSLKSGDSSEATAKDLVVDSGSTDHVIVNKNWFKNMKPIDTTVTNPDGGDTKVLGIGEVEILAKDVNGKTKPLVLRKALFVPGYRTNLISVSSIVDNGHKVVHEAKMSFLCLKSNEKIPITRKGKLFYLSTIPKQENHFANLSGGSNKTQLWHKRFGHVNYRDLKHSLSKDLNEVDENCETCCLAKITKTPVPKRNENKASKAHERVVSDVVGPITPSSKDGYRYFVTFIDEYSSHACVKFIRHKSEVLQKFKEYIAECGTPQILRSDNGTEYTNKNFKNYCTNNKVKQEYTVPETPEQNGVAERYNRTVVETARSLLIESKLPKCYWLRAVDTAAYARNLVKKDKNEKTPYEKFWGRKPKTDHLKVSGCLAYVKNRNREKSKFDCKARKHVFLGYDGNSTAYLLQDVETRKLTRA